MQVIRGPKGQLDKSLAQVTPGEPPRRPSLKAVRALIKRAVDIGHTVTRDGTRPSTMAWDMSGSCTDSKRIELWGRPSGGNTRWVIVAPGSQRPMGLTLEVRCRRCTACLRFRAMVWTNRSRTECRDASRTWLGTLTWSPDEQEIALARARQRCSRRGIDFDALTPSQQFARRCDWLGKDVTRWLKRVRKLSGVQLRYLVVAEAHKSGAPHYHCLIHEVAHGREVGERLLRGAWCAFHGHAKFNLVRDERGATYATKYLAKSALARVRASTRYGLSTLEGKNALEHINNKVSE